MTRSITHCFFYISLQQRPSTSTVTYAEEMKLLELAGAMQEKRLGSPLDKAQHFQALSRRRRLTVNVVDEAGNENYITKTWLQKPGTMPPPPRRPSYQGPKGTNPKAPSTRSMAVVKVTETTFTLAWAPPDDVKASAYVKSVFIIHVGGTRCVASSTAIIMKIHARTTLNVEFIRGYIFIFLFYV
jgi:hypothetical protein